MNLVQHTLARMQTIGLEQMNACALMNRVDTKYVFDVAHLSTVLKSIANDYRVLDVAGTTMSPYENLYFDTPDHQYYLRHHNGIRNRCKCRFRRYVQSDLCFFEVKTKNNKGRTAKQRLLVDRIECDLSHTSREYLRAITGTQPNLLPQLWSRFSRITLVDIQHQERSTLDICLNFSHNGSRRDLPRVVIAEVKQCRRDRKSPLRKALKAHGIRAMRLSKYCLGCMILKPHLKRNRFKRKLDTIQTLISNETTNGNL